MTVMEDHARQLSENVHLVREALEELLGEMREYQARPFGPEASADLITRTGPACVRLCNGDQNKARTLYKETLVECGYMPQCVAQALVRAADAYSLMPDIEPPEVG